MVRDVTRELGYLPLGSRLKRVGERLQAETARFLLNEGVDMPQGVWPLLVTLDQDEAVREGGDQRRKPVGITEKGAAILAKVQSELWPHVEAAVREMCASLDGPILGQLDRIEAELDRLSLDRRAARKKEDGGKS